MLYNNEKQAISKEKAKEIKKDKTKRVAKVVDHIISMKNSKMDPFGSYTGVPEIPSEKPIQDADDL